MEVEEVSVAVKLVGAEATALQLPDELPRISIPITRGWFAAPTVKAITICPLLFAVAVKLSSRAASFPTLP
jgi:hypothetical protein